MSDQQPKTVVVNGREYLLTKFMADTGLKVFMRLAKIVAEPMAKGATLGELDSEKFGAAVGDMISSLMGRLDEGEVIRTVEDLLSTVIPVGTGQTYPLADPQNPARSNWKTHFQGRLADMMTVIYQSVMENFEDFLFVLKLAQKRLDAVRASQASSSQST